MNRNTRPSTKGHSKQIVAEQTRDKSPSATIDSGTVTASFLTRCVLEDKFHADLMVDLCRRLNLPKDPAAYPLTVAGVTIPAPIIAKPSFSESKRHLRRTA